MRRSAHWHCWGKSWQYWLLFLHPGRQETFWQSWYPPLQQRLVWRTWRTTRESCQSTEIRILHFTRCRNWGQTYYESVDSDNVKDTLRTEQSVPQSERFVPRNVFYDRVDVVHWRQRNHPEVGWNDEHQVRKWCLDVDLRNWEAGIDCTHKAEIKKQVPRGGICVGEKVPEFPETQVRKRLKDESVVQFVNDRVVSHLDESLERVEADPVLGLVQSPGVQAGVSPQLYPHSYNRPAELESTCEELANKGDNKTSCGKSFLESDLGLEGCPWRHRCWRPLHPRISSGEQSTWG